MKAVTLKQNKPTTPNSRESRAGSRWHFSAQNAVLLTGAGLIFWAHPPPTFKHFAFGMEQAKFSLNTFKIFTKWNCPFTTHL